MTNMYNIRKKFTFRKGKIDERTKPLCFRKEKKYLFRQKQAITIQMKKRSERLKHCVALAVVRFGHRPPAVTNPQTGPITIHCAAAS